MQVSYKKNGMKNYMIITNENNNAPGLREKMIIRNNIAHLLKMTPQSIDGHSYYYYDIQGKVSLKTLFSARSISESEISIILNGLSELLTELQRYLLSPDEVLFDPSYIWLMPDSLEPGFIYVPNMIRDDRYSILSLAEFLTEHVDEGDRTAAAIAFRYLEAVENGDILPEYISSFGSANGLYHEDNSSSEEKYFSEPPLDPHDYWDIKESVSEEMKPFFEEEPREKKNTGKKISYISLGIVSFAAALYIAFVLNPSLFPIYLTDEEFIAVGAFIAIIFAVVLIIVLYICARNGHSQEGVPVSEEYMSSGFDEPVDKIEYMEYKRQETDDEDEKTVLLNKPDFHEKNPLHPVLTYKDGKNLDITTIPFLLGKMKSRVDGVIDGAGISRIHAMIKEVDGRYYLSDLNSLNGTEINGSPLDANETAEIKEGDKISFANTIMTFHYRAG